MLISFDTETTGVDLHHDARPFFVTTCDEEGNQAFWEWEVDPLTRMPKILESDVEEIRRLVLGERDLDLDSHHADYLVLQNPKFDAKAMAVVGCIEDWPWERTYDTLLAGHLIASNHRHDLTSMAIVWLGENIEPFEKRLKVACDEARRWCRSHLKDWKIAKAGLDGMPSAKEECWKYDTWLPKAVVKHRWETSECYQAYTETSKGVNKNTVLSPLVSNGKTKNSITKMGALSSQSSSGSKGTLTSSTLLDLTQLQGWEFHPPEVGKDYHPWWTILAEYANTDSAVTLPLWKRQEREIRRRNLWAIYQERLKVLPISFKMEMRGLTINGKRLSDLRKEYVEEGEKCRRICTNIAASYDYPLELPKGAVNNSLKGFCFDVLKLEPVRNPKAKTDAPSLDSKNAIPFYLTTLDTRSKPYLFVKTLAALRSRDTAVAYMYGYERFWRPMEAEDWYVLHPSLNPTGTDTLRWSSSSPNEQNISKREGFNLRYCFGPAPGREWWSCDAKNIELRIPAYESGEDAFIALFERPDDYPYFGSNHLLISHLLHKEAFEQCRDEEGLIDGRIFKKRYAATLYQSVKNGNFAVQYGAVDREDGLGTADRTYGIKGAQAMIKARFVKQESLNQKWIKFAERHGYVETMPDKTVDPQRGYPVMCTRTDYGKIKPTVPLNYHVQSTAMWWTMKAMIRCQDQFDEWRRRDGFDGHIALQVHDELVFDLPRCGDPVAESKVRNGRGPLTRTKTSSNLWRIRVLQQLMEEGGNDIGVPTPAGCEYHANNWSEGVTV